MNYIKNLLLLLFLLPLGLYAQTTIPYPAFFANIDNVSSVGGGLYDLTITVNDQSGNFNGTAIDTSNFVVWQDCGRYEIDSVLLKFFNEVVVRINDVDVNGSPILGQASLLQESPQNIGFFVSGILDSRNQCIASYYAQFIGTGSGSGGADTLYLSNGSMLVNGDTIPILSCSTERFVSPFDFTDRVVVSTVSIDTFETLDVFINGVFVNSSAYSINADSLIFSSYVIQNTDEIFIRSCSSTISSSTPNLNSVLSSGNNAGGVQIKNVGNPTDAQDVVTLDYFNNNSSAGGADTLYLSNGTMLVNGDTIPILECNSEQFTPPFDFTDRVVVSAVSIDTFELLNVFINGIHYNNNTYTISGDSLIFNSYTLDASDIVYINVCASAVSTNGQGLNSVLSNSNDAGGLLIKNLGDPVDNQDAVTKSYLEANDKWLETELASGSVIIDGNSNAFIIDTLGIFRVQNLDNSNVDYEVIFSPNTSVPLKLARYEAGDTILIEMQGGELLFRDTSGAYNLSQLANSGIASLFFKDGSSLTEGDTLSSLVKAGASETIQTANFTASIGIINIVNTSSTAITVTPPASPQIGDVFAVTDGTKNAFNNNITINFSGASQNFHSNVENYIMNLNNDYAEFIWVGNATGWVRRR